jgi:hypothetical protein
VSEYIVNPRRAPRAASRCAVQVETPDSAWGAETEDLSAHGCQLVAPVALARGLLLTLAIAHPKVKESLRVEGKVAWGSSQPPWRVGVAFGEASLADSERWFALLVAAQPGLAAGVRRFPDRLPADAMIFLSPPPTFMVDFSAGEVEVLRHVAGGSTVASIRDRLGARWSSLQRAFFSLLERGVVTISRSAAAHPAAWKKVMAELQVDFLTEAPRSVRPGPIIERTALKDASQLDGTLDLDLDPRLSPPPELSEVPPTLAAETAVSAAKPSKPVAVPGGSTAGTGWRGDARARSRDAQECFDLGRSELAAGRSHSAMAHLRRALQLAPGDPEIAAEIGRVMASR